MTNNEFGKTFELRTKKFSIVVIRLSSSLNNSQEARVLRNKLSKSATSVETNYSEANRSRSDSDFKT